MTGRRRVAGLGLALLLAGGELSAAEATPESPWLLAGLPTASRHFADVLPSCVPDAERKEIAEAAEVARDGATDLALRLLPDSHEVRDSEAAASVELLRAILEARKSTRDEYEAARYQLVQEIRAHPDPAARACGWIERARLGLRAGFQQEALADLAIARRELPEAEPELERALAYNLAEAEWLAGRDASALQRHRALASDPHPKVAWVARTRTLLAEPEGGLAAPGGAAGPRPRPGHRRERVGPAGRRDRSSGR